ncbi:MAG: hypothetical protein JNM18_18535 [Planctomycetaceae bacterium]|nr:hypothetical protein [Planctomycetaceae bacterium]
MIRRLLSSSLGIAAWALVGLLAHVAVAQESEHFETWTKLLERRLPQNAEQCTPARVDEVREAAKAVDQWAATVGDVGNPLPFDTALTRARRLLDVKRRIDTQLDQTLALRTQFAARATQPTHRAELRAFLATTAAMIDLSGRLRFHLSDTLPVVAQMHATNDRERLQLVDTLIEYRSTIGAFAVVPLLFETPILFGDEKPRRERLQQRVLELIAASGQASLGERIAEFLKSPDRSPTLVLTAAESLRKIGLSQEVRPGTPAELPQPAITAKSLLARLKQLDAAQLTAEQRPQHEQLAAWLAPLADKGLTEDVLRVGSFEVRPGDWLLMRNPSPFNMFTDLTPGLFTHVGVVTAETGSDGIRRLVLVDMPERGQKMPATNVDTYLLRTLNYVFLRHSDDKVAQAMSDAARSMIDNEIEFDLNFRTARVTELKGQPLAGRKIKTYCAGLLLLCALQSDRPREAFFPVAEFPSSAQTLKNLAGLGLSIGDDFISPTGALFSSQLSIVGRREPMYDPRRDVEEQIFDHFAFGMRDKTLGMKAEGYNDLRIKLAEASRGNPLLAQALSQVVDVSATQDLVSAAKAAAVIDTLDEIAYAASGEFFAASEALRGPPLADLRREGVASQELAKVQKYLTRHADLLQRIDRGQITPWQMYVELVAIYAQQGRAEMDRRFFGAK